MGYKAIDFREFSDLVRDGKVIAGGESFGGGSYSEYDASGYLLRYEMDKEGRESWFKFVPSCPAI